MSDLIIGGYQDTAFLQLCVARFGSSVVRALAMLAGDPGSIPGHATYFSNFSEGIDKPL